MSEKKVVSRKVAIVLGVVCIILVALLAGSVYTFNNQISSLKSQVQDLQKENSSLQSEIATKDNTIASLNSQINNLQNQINSLNSQLESLQNQVNHLNDIVTLNEYVVWIDSETISQPASSYVYWTFSTSYAGYIVVDVETSTTDKTYVEVVWSAYGINFDERINVGVQGTAVFPVLPCSSVEVRVGNTNLFSGATETVTVIYHY